MFSRLRLAVLLVGLLAASFAFAQERGERRTEDRVYRYRGADGRQVFTNAGRVAIGGQAPAPLALPEVESLDFAQASPSQLHQLDRGVQLAHSELQSGERCQAIRASSRVPMRSFLVRGHLRELGVAASLLALALLVFSTWRGRLPRLMPLAPLLGSVYLGYATYARVEQRVALLRDGLRACSSDLPPAEGASASVVKQRLESALSLQATIDRAYAQRSELAERMLQQR